MEERKQHKVIAFADNPNQGSLYKMGLGDYGLDVVTPETAGDIIKLIGGRERDVLILDPLTFHNSRRTLEEDLFYVLAYARLADPFLKVIAHTDPGYMPNGYSNHIDSIVGKSSDIRPLLDEIDRLVEQRKLEIAEIERLMRQREGQRKSGIERLF